MLALLEPLAWIAGIVAVPITIYFGIRQVRGGKNGEPVHKKQRQQTLPTPTIPRPIGFVDRPKLLDQILKPVAPPQGMTGSRIAAICSLHGMGGIGKTELAREAARRLEPKNGIAEVNLRGWDSAQPMGEEEALRELCPQIDPKTDPTLSLPQLYAHWRRITTVDDLVVILDNLRDESLIERLRPTQGMTLITGRERIVGTGIQLVEVDVMEPDEAADLALATHPDLSEQGAAGLAQAVGYLPLAIALAAAYLARTRESVTVLERRVGEAASGKDHLRDLFARVVDFSITDLTQGQRTYWLTLSLPPGDFGLWTVQALWEDDDPLPELGELVKRHLVLPTEGGRWRLHDLLRQYGQSRLAAESEQEQALWRRLGPAALQRLQEINARFDSSGDEMVQALGEFDAELPLFRAVKEWSARSAKHEDTASTVIKFLPLYAELLTLRIANDEYVGWLRASFFEQKRSGEDTDIAKAAGNLGLLYRRLKRYPRALALTKRSLKIYKKLEDHLSQARCQVGLGLIYNDLEEFSKAERLFLNSLERVRGLNLDDEHSKKKNIAQCLGNLGIVNKNLKKSEIAQSYYLECIALFEEINDGRGIAINRASLANLYEKFPGLGDPVEEYCSALKLAEKLGMPEATGYRKCLAEAKKRLAGGANADRDSG